MTQPPFPQSDTGQPKAKGLGVSPVVWTLLFLLLLTLVLVGWRTLAQGRTQPLAMPRPTEASEAAVSRSVIGQEDAVTGPATITATNSVSDTGTSIATDTGLVTNTVTNTATSPGTSTVSITVTDGMVTTSSSALTSVVSETVVSETVVSGTVLSETEVITNPLLHTTNILLLGSDRRPKDVNWRTDVIMIVALDLAQGEAGVISIPRDLYIDAIENHQPNKINVVDYLGEQDNPGGGGPALLADILAQRMGVPIHHYLRFEFEGFKQVVDALGGVEIQVDCPVYDFLEQEDIAINLAPGTHRLSGIQALSYVRTRRQGGDLERARRQQRVALAIRDQMLNENLMPRIPSLMWPCGMPWTRILGWWTPSASSALPCS